MLKLAMWLIILCGVYFYARSREARKQRRERIREEQMRTRDVVDVEAEVIDLDANRP